PDSMLWLKAEMMNFLNEIIVNDRILGNWKNLRQFFDEKVADEEIETFTESMRTYNKKKIPVNSIDIEHRKSDQTADLLLKGKNDRAQKKLFAISTIPGKTWKILQIKDIDKALQKAGYIEKKEVRQ
ncbi:MAG: hypothetical protein JW913_05020, partial [Chitinispirillaceae bacterium]|nr:hypothetical protein [Chitinispirillaceae bacterium]